jgi:hypothetical protein
MLQCFVGYQQSDFGRYGFSRFLRVITHIAVFLYSSHSDLLSPIKYLQFSFGSWPGGFPAAQTYATALKQCVFGADKAINHIEVSG